MTLPHATRPSGSIDPIDRTDPAGRRSDAPRLFTWAVTVYLVALAAVLAIVVGRTGQLVFALDDPYIHFALAENLADHGTFGLEPGAYESASSSPVWTVLLAVGALLTPVSAPYLALCFGVAGSIWIIWNLTAIGVDRHLGRAPALVIGLVLLPISVGLVPLTLTGMEHTLHAAIVLQVVMLLPRLVEGTVSRAQRIAYYVSIGLSGLVRFESPFIAVGCALALLFSPGALGASIRSWSRWRPVLGTIAVASVPIVLFGAINWSAGQYLVPNSVAAKSAVGGGQLLPALDTVIARLSRDRLLVVVLSLVVVGLVFTVSKGLAGLRGAAVALLTAGTLHLLLANVGWFDRYQAYLVIAAAGVLLMILASDSFPAGRTVATAVGVVLIALVLPRLTLLSQVPGAAQNIHDQQQLMAEFFAEHYDGQAIAVNDLGYVAWLHDGPVVDIAGLGTFEVLDAMKNGRADPAFFEALAKRNDVGVVAIYADLFGGIVPESWFPLARWCLTGDLVTAADECVTFYATDRARSNELLDALVDFEAQLPSSVELVWLVPEVRPAGS